MRSKEFGVWQSQEGKGGLKGRHVIVLPWERPKELESTGLGQQRHKNILCSEGMTEFVAYGGFGNDNGVKC